MFFLEKTGDWEKDAEGVLSYMDDMLVEETDDLRRVTNLSNAAALLSYFLEDINWAGFYILSGDTLVLGPFQGEPACTLIPLKRGVCGFAAREEKTVRVPDVTQFPGHIACSGASRSELVVPVFHEGRLWGLVDIDSPSLDRFSERDELFVEKFASRLAASFR